MKKGLLIAALLCSYFIVSAQDTITTTAGKIIPCKIQKEDSLAVFFTTKINDNQVNTYVNKTEIESIKHASSNTTDTTQTEVNLQTSISSEMDKASIGLGFGMNYGGIGGNFLVYPHRNIGIFGGLGYAIAGVGFNVGTKIRFTSNSPTVKVTPYALIMYGYNAAIEVKGAEELSKMFYGPTVGFGIDFNANRAKKGYWTVAILVPIRGSEVKNYIDDLKNNHGVKLENDLMPIAFSVGYRFVIN